MHNFMLMKPLLLSVDYELFYGDDAGTVENCMIRPLNHLMEILEPSGSKMTVFVDVLHYYRLKELEREVPDLRFDRELIEKQVSVLLKRGHDIQMNIHPHWLDARWENNKWRFSYNRFTIHRLWDEEDETDINTITGCITQSRILLEELVRKTIPDYKVRVFRAGGYRIEPFGKIAAALKQNGIRVDSSAAYGMESYSPEFYFDYRKMPSGILYRFENSVLKESKEGYFWEFPKGTVKVPFHRRAQFYILWNFVHTNKGTYGDGKRLGFLKKEQSGHLWSKLGSRYYMFSAEGTDAIRWKYLYISSRPYSQVVINLKNMSPFAMEVVKDSLNKEDIYFVSLLDRIKELGVYNDL